MQISAEFTVAISFIIFSVVFVKWVYPMLISGLDGHIDEIKNKIKEAEKLKEEANIALKDAYAKTNQTEALIAEKQKIASERIQKLYENNERYLNELRVRQEATLKNQLESEFLKHRDLLISKLADLIVEKISLKVKIGEKEIPSHFTKEDLTKLI